MHRRIQYSLLVLGVASFAGCDYFTNVVIPAVDNTPPSSIAAVYDVAQGQYLDIKFDKLSFKVTDPHAVYLAVGATLDSGGAKQVKIAGTAHVHCQRGDIASDQTQEWAPKIEAQQGAVGATVSNGVWTYYPVRFDQVGGCDTGFTLTSAELGWTVWSEDFHGHVSASGGVMHYEP